MEEFELIRIQHCDEPDCDLGQIQFDCPFCNKTNITCDGWYESEEYRTVKLKCEYCKDEFTVEYNRNERK